MRPTIASLLLLSLVGCCPAPSGPTAPQQDDRTALAVALANDQTSRVAEAACTERWEAESDGWQMCVCNLETWRCMAQGWCSQGPGEPTPQAYPPVSPASIIFNRPMPGCE